MTKTFQAGFFTVVVGAVFALLMPISPAAMAQALPAAEAGTISTGFAVPRVAGTLNYAVSASENLTWGYYGTNGAASSAGLSGDMAFTSSSKRDPFSVVLAAGRSWTTGYEASYTFLNSVLRQVIAVKRWNFSLSDSVSYLPGTATTGLSGVAGIGDLGINSTPVQVGSETGQGVLTNYSSIINNTASGSIERPITGKTSLNASGSATILHFLAGSGGTGVGLDSDMETGGGGITHQINTRNSYSGNYAYSNFAFSGATFGVSAPDFITQTASGQFTHQFTRKLGINVSAGPQWTTVSTFGNGQALGVFANASANYTGKSSRVGLSYTRGTNSGYGVVGGALSEGVSLSAGRIFSQVWNCAFTAAYTDTSSLLSLSVVPYSFHTTVDGVQVSRAIVRSLSIYVSYTAENQSSSGNTAGEAVDLFTGLSQVVGFGLTYSPNSIHFGH